MDTTLAGLLHACAATPNDSNVHLILADWLEDHDQPERAELVRLQCQLADWVPEWQERQQQIQRRGAILAQHRERWLGPLGELAQHVEFVRGLAHLWFDGSTFAKREVGEALHRFQEVALLAGIHLGDCGNLTTLSRTRWLGVAPGLSFQRVPLDRDNLEALLTSRHLPNLADLDLSATGMDNALGSILANSDLFQRLSRLGLRGNNLTYTGLRLLLRTAPATLLDLDVAANPGTIRLAETLARRGTPGRVMNSLGMEFVSVPAGTFLMGAAPNQSHADSNEQPQHPVRLTRPFWMGRFAVTQAEFQKVVGSNPAVFDRNPACPVESVNYALVQQFLDSLSALPEEVAAGRRYRLPTEAEWEHACRAGSFTPFSWGNEPISVLFNSQPGAIPGEYVHDHGGHPQPVGSYPPNAFGLYEMHGNIWEWTQDFFGDYPDHPVVDPRGPDSGTARAIRAGCWTAVRWYCTSTHRYPENPTHSDDYTGFRVVLEPLA